MTRVTSGVPVGSYTQTLKTGFVWIAIGTVLGIIASISFLHMTPSQYTATAVVNVEVISTSPFRSDRPASNLIDMQTESVLAGSYATAVLASEDPSSSLSPAEIQSGTSVTADAKGTILRIRFTGTNSKQAIETADSVAAAYLEVREDNTQQRATQTTEAIDRRINELRPSLESALQTISSSESGSTERANAEAETTLIRSEIGSLTNERVSLFNLSPSVGQLVIPATTSSMDVSPSRTTILACGLLAGLVLGIVFAFVRERFARTVGSPRSVEQLVTLPVWASEKETPWDPWGTTFEVVAHFVDGHKAISVVALGREELADDIARHFAQEIRQLKGVGKTELVPSHTGKAAMLAGVREADACMIVLAPSFPKAEFLSILSLMEQVGAEILGVVIADTPVHGKAQENTEQGRAHRGSQ